MILASALSSSIPTEAVAGRAAHEPVAQDDDEEESDGEPRKETRKGPEAAQPLSIEAGKLVTKGV